jgi:hypothetical protein
VGSASCLWVRSVIAGRPSGFARTCGPQKPTALEGISERFESGSWRGEGIVCLRWLLLSQIRGGVPSKSFSQMSGSLEHENGNSPI